MAERSWQELSPRILFLVSCIITVAFCIQALCGKGNRTAGILTLKFDITNLSSTPKIILASNEASAGHSPDFGALDPIRKGTNGPIYCTVGTESFCIAFDKSVTCQRLPLNLSYQLSQRVPGLGNAQANHLREIDQSLSNITWENITGCLIFALLSAGVLWTTFLLLWRDELDDDRSSVIRVPLLTPLTILFSLLCSTFLLAPIIIMYVMLSATKILPLNIVAESGTVFWNCSVAFYGAIAMTFYAAFRPRGGTI